MVAVVDSSSSCSLTLVSQRKKCSIVSSRTAGSITDRRRSSKIGRSCFDIESTRAKSFRININDTRTTYSACTVITRSISSSSSCSSSTDVICCNSSCYCSGRGASVLLLNLLQLVAIVVVVISFSNRQAAAISLPPQKQQQNNSNMETLSNIPPFLSPGDSKMRIKHPKSRKAESCTVKCVNTCIRGDDGEGPLNIRRPLIVFKQGFRTRQYCLVECSDICNLLGDGDDGP